jgi:hypothetical protein
MVAEDIDFVSVSPYLKMGRVGEALKALAGFAVGEPVLIEETFPRECSPVELEEFIEVSKKHAAGWIGFNRWRPHEELRGSNTIANALTLGCLESFQRMAKRQGPRPMGTPPKG